MPSLYKQIVGKAPVITQRFILIWCTKWLSHFVLRYAQSSIRFIYCFLAWWTILKPRGFSLADLGLWSMNSRHSGLKHFVQYNIYKKLIIIQYWKKSFNFPLLYRQCHTNEWICKYFSLNEVTGCARKNACIVWRL